MEIQKLKKRLLKEELKIRRRKSNSYRLLVSAGLLLLIFLVSGGIYYVSKLDKTLKEDYVRGELLLEKGDYEEAAALFHSIYERHPTFELSAQALFQSGEVLNLFLKRYHDALIAYLRVIRDYPDSEFARRAQRQEAGIYKNRLRDYGRAVIAYQNLLDLSGEEKDRIHYELADSYFRLENFEQARIEFETLALNHPQSALLPEVQYRIAVSWSLEGEPQKAESVLRQVVQTWPDHPYGIEARFALAGVLEDREELSAALVLFEELSDVYPNRDILEMRTEQVRERIRKKKGI